MNAALPGWDFRLRSYEEWAVCRHRTFFGLMFETERMVEN